MEHLEPDFFARPTVQVARELLGCRLVHDHARGGRLVGRIVETEAYTENDPACHASSISRDPETGMLSGEDRGRDLFAAPGTAYVYLIYGMHWLLNVVTEPEGTAGAVLIRAVEPEEGLQFITNRRAVRREVDRTNGPGKVTDAFDVDGTFHQDRLTSPPLFLANGSKVKDSDVARSSRIGISKAVDRSWRFFVDGHPYVSQATPSDQT